MSINQVHLVTTSAVLYVTCRNLDGLARLFNVFAVDWLGTGLSGAEMQAADMRQLD
jgi:pimeloyl-ACP methyl ester carboxylesterase